jgi:hypothetical protein
MRTKQEEEVEYWRDLYTKAQKELQKVNDELQAAREATARLRMGQCDDCNERRADLAEAQHDRDTYKAALGRAVALLTSIHKKWEHVAMWSGVMQNIKAAIDELTADPDVAAAGEAWRELEAVYEAAKESRFYNHPHRDQLDTDGWRSQKAVKALDETIAKVDARRGG